MIQNLFVYSFLPATWYILSSDWTTVTCIRESYREDYDEGREYKPDDEAIDTPLENLLLDGVALELKLEPEEKEELEETEGRKLLQRELRDEALRRYEESARTVQDFKNVHATWDKMDANRECRETQLRMEKAARMLVAGTASVEDIALEVGYTDRSSFYRAFGKHFGCTPKEYINQQSIK